jgi:hypothetical protein
VKNCFISIVSLIDYKEKNLRNYLINIHDILTHNFSDFEIILINNGCPYDFNKTILALDEKIRKSTYIINLSKKIDPNNAIVAGLDRANGDYTVILDMDFYDKPHLILELYNKTQKNYDIVYLRYKKRNIPIHKRILFKIFYFIINRYSEITIDMNMHQNRIISRRALNSVLQVRESLRYMKGIFSSVGYNTSYVETDIPESETSEKFSDQFKSAIIAITSFTDIPNKLLMWIFIISTLFCIYIITSTLMVKYLGYDLFGIQRVQVPGFAFIVILLSIIFALLSLILYIVSIYIISINQEIKNRPVYIIESFKKF